MKPKFSTATLFPIFLLLLGTAAARLPFIGNLLPDFSNSGLGNLLPQPVPDQPPSQTERLDYETAFTGDWELISQDCGVSAMHLAITYQNKAVMFDSTVTGPSHAPLPPNNCRPDPTGETNILDCWAHAVEFDLQTYTFRPLKVLTDPWCSSGGFAADGTLVNTGGWKDGVAAVRYATQQILGDGSFIVLGGRRAFNYEFVPAEKSKSTRLYDLPFLLETTDREENNLYPFIHLSTDGNLFVFANNRAILLQPKTGVILREFPPLPGGSRNYPASGMSALLPIDLNDQNSNPTKRTTLFPAHVLICGGAPSNSFHLADAYKTYVPGLKSCGRITITDPLAQWELENMPAPRTIADMLVLPNGDVLIINGAMLGCAGWDFAREPALAPLLYMPAVTGSGRWRELASTWIPRMYHASSAVLPDAAILVAGSNTNPSYNFSEEALFPTELRVEKFRPPYLDPDMDAERPRIDAEKVKKEVGYKESFEVAFTVPGAVVEMTNVKVTMYAPPFTTHGYSMNQRLLVLRVEELGMGRIMVTAPPSGDIAPPGWYMLFVVHMGLPSEAAWVRVHG
ncbi:hypothetical protein HPP92_019749 [Vanilla planifolia]|uniref:Galactose oxidase n=1 Tax=Vanilla planifolia TaxID=51239 RepID=A0A835Q7C6_VANPL|nr:hypothetical protein HPP92_019749 [Vanilla planifolia]